MIKIISRFKVEILVFGVYFLLAIIFTYPLFLKLSSSLYGYTSDNFSAAWYFWWVKLAMSTGQDVSFSPYVGAPFGYSYGVLALESLWMEGAKFLTLLFNELAALNLLFLLSFPFAGLGTYLLTYHLTKNKSGAFLAGVIYSFAPYHFWQGYSHISLAFIHTLPFFFLALIYYDRKNNYFSALIFALTFVFVFLTTFYYGLFAAILTVSFFFLKLVTTLFKRENYLTIKRIKTLSFSGGVLLILLLPSILSFYLSLETSFNATVGSVGNRGLNDFLSLSLRPWDLFLPAPDHPFLGELSKISYKAITKLGNDYKTISAFLPERVVYIGIIPTLLALYGVFRALKDRKNRATILFFTALLLMVVFWALPPIVIIKGINFYLPSYLIYLFISPLRVLVRFGVVILLLASILSGFGFSYLTQPLKGRGRLFLLPILLSLILLEFLPIPPSKVVSFENPPAYYQWLKEVKENVIVAEYPRRFDLADSLIWQRYHGKPLFNMISNEYYKLWDSVAHLEASDNADLLASLGVKYVIYHTSYLYKNAHPFDDLYFTRFEPPPTIHIKDGEKIDFKEYPWLKLLKEYDSVRVYELTSTNSKFFGFNPNRKDDLVWVGENSLELTREANVIYLFNFGKDVKKLSLDYEIEGDGEKISRKFYNGIETSDLDGKVLELRLGYNILRFDSSCTDCKVKVKNIEIKKLN